MRKRYIFHVLIISFLILDFTGQSQQLYVPDAMQQAYKQHTRSEDGKPGIEYFQNHANYRIKADFDPKTGHLKGSEQIVYYNESSDTLHQLVFHLLMNIFQKGVNRDFNLGSVDLHEGVKLSGLVVNGEKIKIAPPTVKQNGTLMSLALPGPLLPEASVEVALDWEFPLPYDVNIRMGRYGDDNWFVAYWYPHIAVYDDVDGWDTHPFTGSAEYYYDFNNFDVTIDVPEHYMVWATGTLQNPQKHFKKNIIGRLDKAANSDSVISVITPIEHKAGNFLKKETQWHFVAEEVPDVAFSVSREYLWDMRSVEVTPGRRVLCSAVYREESKDFSMVADIVAKSIDYFSHQLPGIPFPYPSLTAFNGKGGMEFPMMINDGDGQDLAATVHVTAHEIGHNYFPFYVMTNESYYAFMDEGLVSFFPREVENHLLENFNAFAGIIPQYGRESARTNQVPLMVRSYMISDYSAYRTHAYTRPANALYFLRDMLGQELFGEALQTFIHRWAKKHPTPYDFFNTIEDVSGMELDWYWKPWFFELGYPDLAVGTIDKSANGYNVEILRKGTHPVPVELNVIFKSDTTYSFRRNASVWSKGQRHFIINVPEQGIIEQIRVGGALVPDAFPEDNKLIIKKK
jgi:hypothetical protein